ncbi:MAG: hypothetical protein LVT47_01165 [Cyanobacteria bacterium LVE1205-1]|jgi:hypothetical protein
MTATVPVLALAGHVASGAIEPYPKVPCVHEVWFYWSCDDAPVAALGGSGWETLVYDEDDGAPSPTWSAGDAPVDPAVIFTNLEGFRGAAPSPLPILLSYVFQSRKMS